MRAIGLAAVLFLLAASAGCGSSGGARGVSSSSPPEVSRPAPLEVSNPAPPRGDRGGVSSISCAAAGECAAGGYYDDSQGEHAFVVSETNGSWGNPIEVQGAGMLTTRDSSKVDSISCAAAGECAAAGSYYGHLFVVSETNGSWGNAIEVPGTSTMGNGAYMSGISISCAAAGECAAAGYFTNFETNGMSDRSPPDRAFVVSETNGSWGKAIEVSGLHGGDLYSISCPAAGECTAAGGSVLVRETNGRWGNATRVRGGYADVISCSTAGDCAAGGANDRRTPGMSTQALVFTERNGRWGNAIGVPGTETDFGSKLYPTVQAISCPAAGECAVGGYFPDGWDRRPFVASERYGRWGEAITVPGLADGDGIQLISCAAPGECAAVGGDGLHGFVVSETNGRWGEPIEVPGPANVGSSGVGGVSSISCAAPGECAAGGGYRDSQDQDFGHAFVLNETNGSWDKPIHVLSFPAP